VRDRDHVADGDLHANAPHRNLREEDFLYAPLRLE